MRRCISAFLLIASIAVSAAAFPASNSSLSRRAITQDLMDQFIRFTKLSFAADDFLPCNSPLGLTVVKTLNDAQTDTQGFVVRDDSEKQIIAAFRGSSSIQDFLTDFSIALVPFSSPGVTNTNNAEAHFGFLSAFNSVASDMLSAVSSELQAHPDYELISTGHSLGAALASLGGVSLASNFPGTPLQVFTFGQPRTGDSAYADLAEQLIGVDKLFRAVHTSDGVPTLVPRSLGYEHHETEYWNFQDPCEYDNHRHSAEITLRLADRSDPIPATDINNVKVCSGREDPTCSDSIPSGGINSAHLTYFGENVVNIIFDPSSVCF
ncbi:alpha/beta-hydrolase [Sanghuangporus baumii]|uniref:Alpha/beta-hydrolase n=1 Tax=Sanghuangporus baumii TaxID=108892 RepID=A0A9Q5N9Y3_SANBA|nr:alpha/beta-hydrolase [Sanghuangporus baumii]